MSACAEAMSDARAADLATAVTLASTADFISRSAARSVSTSWLPSVDLRWAEPRARRRTVRALGSEACSSQNRRRADQLKTVAPDGVVDVSSGFTSRRVQFKSVVELTPASRASAARLRNSSVPGPSITFSINCATMTPESSHTYAHMRA